ncbi:hypothetical protein [Microvirga zambiensis]|uniref:hypothetical protein n=1 Tax=Microvirga zambiensis TaxID=1402137 RepID=UPI00191F039E|nr:hypothetical protein [Microvirga zambiensis]
MTLSPAPQPGLDDAADRPLATRRELLAAATALLASAAAGSPAQASFGAEGYFLVFDRVGNNPADDNLDRVFFIPSAWLELFEVTDVYKARYPTNWKEALKKIRNSTASGKKQKFQALYADTIDPDVQAPFPGLAVIPAVPPDANHTYLAAMISPT